MGGIYEVVCRCDGLKCHDVRTKFYKDWFKHSKVDSEGIHRHTDKMETACLLLYFHSKEVYEVGEAKSIQVSNQCQILSVDVAAIAISV
jgi:hypothetical protein